MLLLILLVLITVAWFVPILWVAVGIFIVFWIVNKMADEKIANMAAQIRSYEDAPSDDMSSDEADDETLILRNIK